MYHLVFAMTSSSRLDPFFTSAEREGKGFATLRKVDFFDKIGDAKSVGFRFYSAI